MTTLVALLTPAFACVALLRGLALWQSLSSSPPATPAHDLPPLSDGDLPFYSVLVPLYREAHMAVTLVEALGRLDWPVDKRDIVYITEAEYEPTLRALEIATHGRPDMRIVSVPAGLPRTKPRALMYALPMTEGEFVVVFDAEDLPEPKQLRLAYGRFRDAVGALGCDSASKLANKRMGVIPFIE